MIRRRQKTDTPATATTAETDTATAAAATAGETDTAAEETAAAEETDKTEETTTTATATPATAPASNITPLFPPSYAYFENVFTFQTYIVFFIVITLILC
jgi:hypothetical protein